MFNFNQIQPAHFSFGRDPLVLSEIYKPYMNLVVWSRNLDKLVQQYVDVLQNLSSPLVIESEVTIKQLIPLLEKRLPVARPRTAFIDDVSSLALLYADLFEAKKIGVRLNRLDHAMCPRFHVDRVTCRLVTTYAGIGTQWLANSNVDRTKLDKGNKGLPDELSGIYQSEQDIQVLETGSIALLKGEKWPRNEGNGVVHRSPSVSANEPRLLLSLDFVE